MIDAKQMGELAQSIQSHASSVKYLLRAIDDAVADIAGCAGPTGPDRQQMIDAVESAGAFARLAIEQTAIISALGNKIEAMEIESMKCVAS